MLVRRTYFVVALGPGQCVDLQFEVIPEKIVVRQTVSDFSVDGQQVRFPHVPSMACVTRYCLVVYDFGFRIFCFIPSKSLAVTVTLLDACPLGMNGPGTLR